jgi:geranylgeranyl pyrophosphate synthase
MNIYIQACDMLLEMSVVKAWPEIQNAVEKMATRLPRDWQLPVLACEAVGGQDVLAIPAAAAIGCMQMSIILVDDILDDDPRGEYRRIGAGAASNLAIALQAIGMEAVCKSKTGDYAKLDAILSLSRMMLITALGQHMDAKNLQDEDAYWELVRTKSSPFFGAALHVGALMGGADPEIAAYIKKYGHLYGEMIQIHDDMKDTMETPANPDWIQGRAPLPILFAQVVDHPDRERFLKLRGSIPDPDALAEAQTILIRCGAVSYCIDQLLRRVQAAREILESISLASPEKLEGLLADVVDPVMNLFAEIGIEQPEAFLQPSEQIA